MIHFRTGTSDERVLKEVLEKRCYRRALVGFDVEPGEVWLDLGANIGAFALYCQQRGATAECYEPDPKNFGLLKKNVPKFVLTQAAVTAELKDILPWFVAKKQGVHSRSSILAVRSLHSSGVVENYYAGRIANRQFDGVKMDIEGSEGPILDLWLLPSCAKLVLEYHTSRDASVKNLARRIRKIKQHFRFVKYPPEYDRAISSGSSQFKSFFDRLIFAWEPK